MLSIDRRTGILTARRKVAQKAQQVDGEERRKTTRVRPESLPLVVPNGCIRSNGSSTGSKTRPTITEMIDNQEPPIRLRALPPLRHCTERKKKPTRIHPILSKRDDTADTQQPSAVVCTAPQLGSLRRPTPDSEETVNLVTPLSQRTPSVIVELGIQTDDNFDRDIALVIEQLVASAISRAIESLKKENEIARLRRQAQSYKELFNKLHHSTKFTIEEKNKVIESLKHEAFLRYTRNLAQETCNQITEASLAHVAKLEEITPKTRSIGLDTRSMNRHFTKLQLMTTELEEDFFPWIFARADRMFRRAMTTIQLENSNYSNISLVRKFYVLPPTHEF
ncbi:hypothetical protein V3C99_003301 [Haemonchus contortus]